MATIVCTGPVEPLLYDMMQPFGEVVVAPDYTVESLIPMMYEAVGLVVRGEGLANKKVIESSPNLKVIGRPGVGYNNVDIAAATARKIPVVFAPGAGARAVAEATMAFMLALCKNLSFWDTQLKAGNWHSRYESKPGDFDGATLGIVGLGRIGQIVAQLAMPFQMKIIAHDPYADPDIAKTLGVKMVSLEQLIAESDFITMHAPATDQTHGIINADILKHVKPGAILVNLARGDLIMSLDILYDALQDGRLAAVGLDVFTPEPPDINHPIFKLPNCLTAPHSLGGTHRALEKLFNSMGSDMVSVLEGRRPQHLVNPEVYA